MFRWIILLMVCLVSCGPSSHPGSPITSTITVSATSSPGEPEIAALSQFQQRYELAEYDTITATPDTMSHQFQLAYPTMAGAGNVVTITRYLTVEAAAAALGPTNTTFHHRPAVRQQVDPILDPDSQHYSGKASLRWQDGVRIYAVVTGYHSTMRGEVGSPDPMAEGLYGVRVDP